MYRLNKLALKIAKAISEDVEGTESQVHDRKIIAEVVLKLVTENDKRWEKVVGYSLEEGEALQRLK